MTNHSTWPVRPCGSSKAGWKCFCHMPAPSEQTWKQKWVSLASLQRESPTVAIGDLLPSGKGMGRGKQLQLHEVTSSIMLFQDKVRKTKPISLQRATNAVKSNLQLHCSKKMRAAAGQIPDILTIGKERQRGHQTCCRHGSTHIIKTRHISNCCAGNDANALSPFQQNTFSVPAWPPTSL